MANASQGLVLGFDVGTSGVKAALFSRDGCVAASGRAPYALLVPRPGWAEQRPDDWWTAMADVTPSLLASAGAGPADIVAVGIAAQMCGVTPVGRDGAALANCLISFDTRSRGLARALMGGWPRYRGYGLLRAARWLRLTGGAPNLSGKDPISKMLWFRAERPEVWQKTAKLLDVKDYLVQRCTGRFTTSFDCAHLTWLFDARAGRRDWATSLLRASRLERTLLPDVRSAPEIAGELQPAAAAALGLRPGTPVTVGLGDVSATAVGSGPGPHLSLGTSAWLASPVPRPCIDPERGIGTITGADGTQPLLIAVQENAGSAVAWAMSVLGFGQADFAAFEQAAARASPRRDGPLFLPWLYGERVPIDEPQLRGTFLNLSAVSDRCALARAVYEGVALNIRWAAGAFERLAGGRNRPLRLVGGGATSLTWCQLIADVLQRPIEQVEEPALAGARGSAMTAALAIGWFPDLGAAGRGMIRVARTFQPDQDVADLYTERFAQFAGAYQNLSPWYRRHGEAVAQARGSDSE